MAKKEKAPAFQFYPRDWISDINVVSMTPAQRGIYIHLLSFMWLDENCCLPNIIPVLKNLSNGSEKDIEVVLKCFEKSEGKIFNKRLLAERKKQKEFKKKSSEAGKKSAAVRKAKVKVGSLLVDQTFQPKSNSSSSIAFASSSSSSNNSSNEELSDREIFIQIIPENLKTVNGFEDVWLKWVAYMKSFPKRNYKSVNAEAHLREIARSVYPVEMINKNLSNANGYLNPLTEKDILEIDRKNKKQIPQNGNRNLTPEEISAANKAKYASSKRA